MTNLYYTVEKHLEQIGDEDAPVQSKKLLFSIV